MKRYIKYIPYAILIISLASSLTSLYFSEIMQLPPCVLCWYQRIFFYPQLILLAMAIFKKDKKISDYILGLGVPGLIIAINHVYIQFGGDSFIPCGIDGGISTCGQRFVWEFGYIGIPMMSLTGFAAIITLMLIQKLYKKNR